MKNHTWNELAGMAQRGEIVDVRARAGNQWGQNVLFVIFDAENWEAKALVGTPDGKREYQKVLLPPEPDQWLKYAAKAYFDARIAKEASDAGYEGTGNEVDLAVQLVSLYLNMREQQQLLARVLEAAANLTYHASRHAQASAARAGVFTNLAAAQEQLGLEQVPVQGAQETSLDFVEMRDEVEE